jgi:membrane associated rhomboid family serine protease
MRPAAVGFQCPDDVAAARREAPVVRNQFGARATYGRAYVTLTVLAINIIAYILQGFPITEKTPNQFSVDYESINGYIAIDHEYWRLLTGGFLHLTIWHIALNMLVLMLVGPALEAMLGHVRYGVLYLLSAIGGNLLPFLVKDLNYAVLGASGAIYGLFAAYWVLARKVRADTSAITGTIVLNLILTVTIPGISLLGHLGGLFIGAVVGAIFAFTPRRPLLQFNAVALVAVVMVVAALVRASSSSLP